MSGKGRACEAAGQLAETLRDQGIEAGVTETPRTPAEVAALAASLHDREALVVLGGDGSVRGCAPACIEAGKPLYAMPFGNESLFCRAFGMSRSSRQVASALRAGCVREIDLGEANGEPFLLMAGVGFDADVVHDVAARRRGPVSHLSYVGPVLRNALAWRGPRLRLAVDGGAARDLGPGALIVANIPTYALGLDPVRWARADDGRLDALSIRASTVLGVALAVARCWLGLIPRGPGGDRTPAGARITVDSDVPFRYQLDGDAPSGCAAVRRIDFTVSARRLKVLVPPGSPPESAAVSP